MESILADDAIGFFTTSDLGPIDQTQKKPDVQVDFERVRDFQINTNNDMLMNISGGMLGSKDIEYNIYNKSYKTREYKYFDDFVKIVKEEKLVQGLSNDELHDWLSDYIFNDFFTVLLWR